MLGMGLPSGRGSDTFGYTEAYRTAKMSFAESGVIVELPVKVGDRVEPGQVLARLDYKVLEQELVMAEEQLRIRRLRHEKLGELQKKGHVPTEEFERAKADLVIDQAKVDRIRAQLEMRTLRAPFAGVVSEVKREVAESISLQNAHILTVVETNRLLVNFHLHPETAAKFQPGTVTELSMPNGRRTAATVEFVSPVIDAASRTVHVRFVIPNPTGTLRAGERIDLEPRGGRREDAAVASAGRSSPGALRDYHRQADREPVEESGAAFTVDPVPAPRTFRELGR